MEYATLSSPAAYVSDVLDQMGSASSIGVFEYDAPDISSPTPLAGRLRCVRRFDITASAPRRGRAVTAARTQWAHMREGSTTRDAFFRFLQVAKRLSTGENEPTPPIPLELQQAARRIAPEKEPKEYLSSTADNKLLSKVWRTFWFEWVATADVLTPWRRVGSTYQAPRAKTSIERDDGRGKSEIFEGRASGLKETLVEHLNAGTLSEGDAWEGFAGGLTRTGAQKVQGVSDRAHSYREDLDSALSQLRWIDNDGRPTDYGYRYMTVCERYGGPNSAVATEYVGATLLQSGHYGSFLHYVHRLSERKFSSDPLAFTRGTPLRPVFNDTSYGEYLDYLEEHFCNELKVMRKVSGRARPRRRTVFQAELTLLRNYGFVSERRHRLGVGIPIDWERVHEAMNVAL